MTSAYDFSTCTVHTSGFLVNKTYNRPVDLNFLHTFFSRRKTIIINSRYLNAYLTTAWYIRVNYFVSPSSRICLILCRLFHWSLIIIGRHRRYFKTYCNSVNFCGWSDFFSEFTTKPVSKSVTGEDNIW